MIEAFNLKRLCYGFDHLQKTHKVDSTLDLEGMNLINFIVEQSVSKPVLVYCTPTFKEELKSVASVLLAEETSNEQLRALDIKNQDHYPIIAATTVNTMRGIDYRAPTTGIILIVA